MISHKIIKYVAPPPTQYPRNNWLGNGRLFQPLTKADIDAHLLKFPYRVGDWLVYHAVTQHGSGPLTADKCNVVVEINDNPLTVREFQGQPKTFLLMQLSGCSAYCRAPDYKFGRDPWTRWDEGGGLVVVSDEERSRMNDDFVQNYIKEHLPKATNYVR